MLFSAKSRYATALSLLTVLAFLLRALRLDAQSFWYDEGVTAMVAQLNWSELVRWTANDIQPPLYYMLMALWGRLAGWSEWSLRFVSVCFGTLSIPLTAVVTVRLSHRRGAGLLAALLTALHPLLIYYSQEARMYALLTTLGLLLGYLVIVASEEPSQRWPLPIFVVTASAAIYTHYFAFFLLLALGITFVVDQLTWQRGASGARPWAVIGRYALANVAVLLLYLPWIGSMLNRFSVDNSYWQGQLKLLEATRSVLISFVAGETVAERVGIWLLALYALITLLAIVRLANNGSTGRRTLTYGLLWLLVPVVSVLALTAYAPKFNPRYVLIALPGLLLIWGAGLGMRGEDQRSKNETAHKSPIALPESLLPYIPIILLCAGFIFSTTNWFGNPAFRKDQWRELVIDLRHNVQPHEAIVLVSGHAWPVWHYYAPDLPVVRLPEIDVLDVDSVLDFAESAGPIREAVEPLSDRPGVWLVGWQDEVVDPTQVVPVQLELAGREKGLSSRYWGIELRRFSQLKPNWITPEAPIEVAVDANFGDQVTLRGYRSGDSGELLLFWAVTDKDTMPDADYWMVGKTQNADGDVVAQVAERRLSDYRYPSFRWPQGRSVMGILPAADWLGADPQPGSYTFELQVYDANDVDATPLALPDGETTLVLPAVEAKID